MKRKGYNVRAAIPADLLAALNAGSEEPQTLVNHALRKAA